MNNRFFRHPFSPAAFILAAVAGLWGIAYSSRAADAPGVRIPVILDTDIGTDIDDTWALALLLRCPELDVRLVVSDTGNTEYRAAIIARLLEVAGRTDIPVGIGIKQTDKRGA